MKYLIAGLGNIGAEYTETRHNIGFSAVTALADIYGISMDMKKHRAVCGKGDVCAAWAMRGVRAVSAGHGMKVCKSGR